MDECERDGQKDHHTDQREQKSSFHHYFSIPLAWTRYSPASLCDAKIDTSRIKLANRDSAVLTPDESGWFRALRIRKASGRGNSQARARTGQKNGEWGVGMEDRGSRIEDRGSRIED